MHQIQFQEKSIMLILAFKLFLNLRLRIDSLWARVATICSGITLKVMFTASWQNVVELKRGNYVYF